MIKRKKVTVFFGLLLLFVVLVLMPVKQEADVTYSGNARFDSNGRDICYCKMKEDSCSCVWHSEE